MALEVQLVPGSPVALEVPEVLEVQLVPGSPVALEVPEVQLVPGSPVALEVLGVQLVPGSPVAPESPVALAGPADLVAQVESCRRRHSPFGRSRDPPALLGSVLRRSLQ